MKYDKFDNQGYYENDGQVLTFELLSPKQQEDIDKYQTGIIGTIPNTGYYQNETMKINNFTVAVYGKEHNNLPLELRDIISKNHILPEILEKQIRFLYGQGTFLYREEVTADNQIVKVPVIDKDIQNWLNSWKENGLQDDYRFYLQKIIRDFYYTEGVFVKYVLNKSRRLSDARLPVRGLEHVSVNHARLATQKSIEPLANLELNDFDKVIIGNWLYPVDKEFSIFPVLDESKPFEFPQAINYTKNNSFSEEVYSYPPWYYGLRDWIKGSNLNAKYINSFLKNSLSAKLHVIIPYSWVNKKKEVLQSICIQNRDLKLNKKPIIEEYQGVKLETEYRESMLDELIKFQLRKITELMSGEGENQGKLFATWSINNGNQIEGWEFREIPLKYKEFIESIIKFDERSVQVIVEGKGIDPSISNVSKEGIISKSGSDTYYNYLIYLHTLEIPEFVCTYDINRAIHLNFPDKKNIRLGFYHKIPQKQENVSPDNRITSNKN